MLAFGEAGLLDDLAGQDLPALTPEETLLGVNALAAPVFDHGGRLVATVTLIGSIQHLSTSPAEEHVAAIRDLASAISQTQGHQVR